MIGLYLFLLSQVAFLLPVLLSCISNIFLNWLLRNMDIYAGYALAAFTVGAIGIIIMTFQGISSLLTWLF